MNSLSTALLTVALLLSCAATALASGNFSDLTNEELAALRGRMNNESTENREAFRKEWQQRVAHMTTEERKSFEKAAGINRPESDEEDDNAGCN